MGSIVTIVKYIAKSVQTRRRLRSELIRPWWSAQYLRTPDAYRAELASLPTQLMVESAHDFAAASVAVLAPLLTGAPTTAHSAHWFYKEANTSYDTLALSESSGRSGR